MSADYYGLLSRAIAALDPNTASARHSTYNRARQMLVDHLRAMDPPLSEAAATAEQSALEAAIKRIETEAADASAASAPGRRSPSELFPRPLASSAQAAKAEPRSEGFTAARGAASKPSSVGEAAAPTKTGALWTLLESFRIVRRQPAILLVVVQAAIVELVAPLAGSSLGFYAGSSLGFYFVMLWGLFVLLYTFAGIWGSLIDAIDKGLQPLRFWI